MNIRGLTRLVLAVVGAAIGGALAWRYAARRWQVPCPPSLAWVLDSGIREWIAPTPVVMERMGPRPGMNVLEVGPGVGHMTIPVARRLAESGVPGRLVCLEIQPDMARVARRRVEEAGLTNVEVREGDVTTTPQEPDTYDLAFLVTVLGEIPDRNAAISSLRDALKPGGALSFTEIFGDPHYQFYADLEKRCLAAGLEPAGRLGSWLAYTANFRRPA
ncbi:MAG: class I SAM-dependent methyltransferase [Chloroflexi bacterium]|nr:class I SAM-dependent methyltransferase [Chloroflexota bacterium]